jgi:lipopolysaccharide transport system ATP-binding protein
MSSSQVAVSVRDVSKVYQIAQNAARFTTAGEALMHRLRHPFSRIETESFYALRDVNFDVEPGNVVGVIGRNGAGKSTLLKILSRITEPSRGQIDLYGRVGSLLEVGTGFHPELTGRENIYLNGAILGMQRREIDRSFDAIVEFAGVSQFLDTPVKRYSSGMYVRLAFAVAAHLNSDILLVDEVLAVGDAEFQRKCLGKMRDVATSGRTVLFVSHHMQSVTVLCNRAIYMEKGRVVYHGDVPGAVRCYIQSFAQDDPERIDPQTRSGSGELRFTSVAPTREFFACGEEKTVDFTISRMKPFNGSYFVSAHVTDDYGVVLLHCDSRLVGHWIEAEDRYEGRFSFRSPWLKPGAYHVDLFICHNGILDQYERAARLQVIPLLPYPAPGNTEATTHGAVFADFAYETRSGAVPELPEASIEL